MSALIAPEPPAEPKDLFESFLASLFGGDSWILYVFVFGTWAFAWFELAKSAAEHGRVAYGRAVETPAGARGAIAFWTLLAVGSQAAYLALSYFIAGHIRQSISGTKGPADVDFSAWFAPPADASNEPVFWIWFLIAIGVAWIGWVSAVSDGLRGYRAFTWLLLAMGFVACFVPFLVAGEQPDPLTVDRMKTMGALTIAYEVSAVLTVYAPAWCVSAWRHGGRPVPPKGPVRAPWE